MTNQDFDFHIVSDGNHSIETLVEKALLAAPYVDFIQLREKQKSSAELYETIQLLLAAGIPSSKITVNDRADVAHVTQVAGVQLAFHSLHVAAIKKAFPFLRIGKSIHSVTEAKEAEESGADYLLFGHIYQSSSKPGKQPNGLQGLRNIVETVTIPVIAIGGIQPAHVNDIMETGANGMAVMSGVFSAPHPEKAARTYKEAYERSFIFQERSNKHVHTSEWEKR
ncbi:thiamine phosphate synthase [Salipaludibacillus sp. CF4.18]|uniref:thiamine phosphate synthase n=1 Tax=Salipaludibacillus sp. CF4.18 TaxID=3373081 RepID=UPI003EE79368